MYTFLVAIEIVISVLLVIVILMQNSKGGGLPALSAEATSEQYSVFGGRLIFLQERQRFSPRPLSFLHS